MINAALKIRAAAGLEAVLEEKVLWMGGGCGCRGGVLKSSFMMILELNQMGRRKGFLEGTQSAFAH